MFILIKSIIGKWSILHITPIFEYGLNKKFSLTHKEDGIFLVLWYYRGFTYLSEKYTKMTSHGRKCRREDESNRQQGGPNPEILHYLDGKIIRNRLHSFGCGISYWPIIMETCSIPSIGVGHRSIKAWLNDAFPGGVILGRHPFLGECNSNVYVWFLDKVGCPQQCRHVPSDFRGTFPAYTEHRHHIYHALRKIQVLAIMERN